MHIAYVTLLTTEDYFAGLVTMVTSLKATQTSVPIYCIVTPNINDAIINSLTQELGINIIRKNTIPCPNHIVEKLNSSENHRVHHWQNTFTKLHIFDLTQFDKIVYLDSDLFIYNSIDDLFARPHMSAVIDSMFLYNNITDIEIIGDEYFKYFNAGLMVIEPNHQIFEECLEFLEYLPNDRFWGDQNLLAHVFKNWKNQAELKLPLEYNCLVTRANIYEQQYWFNPNNIKVWHFVDKKPWQITSEELKQKTGLEKVLFVNYLQFMQLIKENAHK